jgi:hypothetical protein
MADETVHENLHGLFMGRPGGGKSTLAATFPKPMLVLSCDPPGKEKAYLDRGTPSGYLKGDYCYYREVKSKNDPDKLIIRVEYWGEPNPFKPTSYPRFVTRTAHLESEIEQSGWRTVILDTSTYFELSARSYSEHGINSAVKDGRQHYAFSTHACEQHIMQRWPNLLLCNSLVLCHIDDQKDEAADGEGVVTRKMVALPGKLPNKLPGGYGEVWRVYYAGKDKEGKPVHLVQTQARTGDSHDCKSLMGFKDGSIPHYTALWDSLEQKANA